MGIMIADFGNLNFLIELIVTCVIAALILLFFIFYSRRIFPTLFILVGFGILICGEIFTSFGLMITGALVSTFTFILHAVANAVPARKLFQNNQKDKLIKHHNPKSPDTFVDTSKLYEVLADTVQTLSETKTGALITLQRNDDLVPFIKNGVNLGNVPVTKEILLTIFFPKTRLHDGAVIIKDNYIICASAYYALSTVPMSGKMGTRHRAAIGISEQTDSVTIVVSEETGRISIAENGNLSHVLPNEFLNVFTQIMNEDKR